MVAEVERDRAQAPEPSRSPSKPKKKSKRGPRVILEPRPDGDTQGGLLRIKPTPGFRDREVSISLVLFLAGPFAIMLGGIYGGATGALVATAICVATVVMLLVSAPTWHVRWTRRNGEVIVYKRNPRRPSWAGRCSDLLVDTSITRRRNKFIVWLRFKPTAAFKYFFPLSDKDVTALRQAATDAGFERKSNG